MRPNPQQEFTPDKKLIENYARLMVHYALNDGNGIHPGETVFLVGQECSRPLYLEIRDEIWRSGGNVIDRYLPNDTQRYGLNASLLKYGSDSQLTFFAKDFWQGIATEASHILFILSEPNVHALKEFDPKRVGMLATAADEFMNMRAERERLGKQGWSLCLYPTESLAKEAGMTLDEYWGEIINACYLNDADPVTTWKGIKAEIGKTKEKLTALEIESIHLTGEDVDLHIGLGDKRQWLGGTGKNVPSSEVFISPDYHKINGWMRFNQPLYYAGTRISGIYLKFENGVAVEASATENEPTLLQMLSHENANRVGEFSLTDARASRISRFMAITLYDENMGGTYGNSHIAVGKAYREAYDGDGSQLTEEQWDALGFNKCSKVHTDIVSTTNRTATAKLKNGETKVIYTNGHFTLD